MSQPDAEDMVRTFIRRKEIKDTDFPMYPPLIAKWQEKDKYLQKLHTKDKDQITIKEVERTPLVHLNNKIYIPIQLQYRVVAWYHKYLAHPGEKRTEETISQFTTWRGLRSDIRKFCKKCRQCQLWKKNHKKYGHLPAKEAEADPWTEVHVDMVGPLKVKTTKGTKSLLVLMCIDPATGWFEVAETNAKSAHMVMDAFHNCWLTRYPRPMHIRFDNGGEFKDLFNAMCKNYGLEIYPTTNYNPRSNGIIERVHQVLGDSLCTMELGEHDLPDHDPFGASLQATAWAIRSTFHTTLQATPGQLVFGRDMVLSLPFRANWAAIREHKQKLIDKGVKRENKSRVDYTYRIGDQVLYKVLGINPKMDQPRVGPYRVTSVYKNGTVKIQRGAVAEVINIRNIVPFFS